MEVTVSTHNTHTEIRVTGIVGKIWEADEIITALENQWRAHPDTTIRLIFDNTFTIPSRLIGALLNMIREHGIRLEVVPLEWLLYQLLERLNLLELLNVTFRPNRQRGTVATGS